MRDRVVSDLRQLSRDLFVAKGRGNAHARLARAHGYVDGYMRAVLELGVLEKAELLAMVTEERALADDPATTIVRSEEHVSP